MVNGAPVTVVNKRSSGYDNIIIPCMQHGLHHMESTNILICCKIFECYPCM